MEADLTPIAESSTDQAVTVARCDVAHANGRPVSGLSRTAHRVLHVGSVSFLNSKPLIWGLDKFPDLKLGLDVPSSLIDDLRDHVFDIALLPVIDYQLMDGLRIVPSACIGCDGETLTVRIFSKVPVERIRTIACDTDSHTSVALARVIFAELYGRRPELVDWESEWTKEGDRSCDAKLLIGDKVVCEEPSGFEYQLDLGAAWRRLTGMPFVFATWIAREGVDLRDLPERLEQAKRGGLAHVDDIIKRYALPLGWPAGLALQYLTMYLKYDVGPRQLEAMERFYDLACKHGVIESVRKVKLYVAR